MQNQSYFGYTVHLNADENNSSVIIGAPKANTDYEKDIKNPGVIYQCKFQELLNGNNKCEEFLRGQKSKKIQDTSQYKINKYPEHGLLGAAIDGTNRRDGRFVACAPGWSNDYEFDDEERIHNPGICYWGNQTITIDDNQTLIELNPLLAAPESGKQQIEVRNENGEKIDYFIYRYGEFGFSIHLANASEVIFGSPGLNNWTGGIIRYADWNKPIGHNNQARRSINEPTSNKKFKPFDQITISKINKADVPEGSYFGYAVSTGIFDKSKRLSYVASAPKYQDIGSVFIFKFVESIGNSNEKDIKIEKQFIGKQFGEYFGSSLCVIDVNGDNLDDVIIGAPRHSLDRDNIDAIDEGAVYVYVNKGNNWQFEDPYNVEFNGMCSSQFGTSISSLGDLDQDGYNDIVVGAPYENSGRGAVYIYLGGKNRLHSKPSQYLLAEHLDTTLLGFGFSVSRGVDIDNNNYNDLAVGSYISGHVLLFRSNPVVNLIRTITPSVHKLNLDVKQFNISVCFNYADKYVQTNTIKISVDISTNGPLFAPNNGTQNFNKIMEIQKNHQSCSSDIAVYLKDKHKAVQDFSIPVIITMKVNIIKMDNINVPFCPTCPVLHPTSKENVTISIPFAHGCKNDTCYPELKLHADFTSSKHVIGSHSNLILNISIHNSGEPAYGTKLQIVSNLNDLKFVLIPDECIDTKLPNHYDNSTNCSFKYLESNSVKRIQLIIDTHDIPIDYTSLECTVMFNSTGVESNYTDNQVTLTLPLLIQSDFRITGSSTRDVVIYKDEKGVLIENLNPVNYTYTVQNSGPSAVRQSEVTFFIPVSYDNKELLHMHEVKATIEKQEIYCLRDNNTSSNFYTKFTNENVQRKYKFPLEQTIFFNCSENERITCVRIICKLGLMEKNKQKAIIQFSLQPITKNIETVLSDLPGIRILEMNILTVVTPLVEVDRGGVVVFNKGTTFRDFIKETISIFWIIVAVIVGAFVLGVITYTLMKYGFFHRSHKDLMQGKLIKEGSTEELD